MPMDAATELSLLESVYQAWLTAGCPQELSTNGRSYTKANILALIPRMDMLRAAVYRQTNGMGNAVRFRMPE